MPHISKLRTRHALVLATLLILAPWSARWAVAADTAGGVATAKLPALSAAQIADKSVAARGGLQAWRGVQTQSITGKMEAGAGDSLARSETIARGGFGASARQSRASAMKEANKKAESQVELPFRLELKQPNKSRLEIDFSGRTALQVYDGRNGWKVRPFLNREEVEPFTAEETQAQSAVADMRGPLVDYASKGTKLELVGTETVEGHQAYNLKLTARGGEVKHIWIDGQSFLDIKVEGIPRRFDGKMHNVYVYQRDFRNVQGLMIPFVYETAVEGVMPTHKMTFESVTLNHPLDDLRFAKPQISSAHAEAAPAVKH
jgi:hypothetical protein